MTGDWEQGTPALSEAPWRLLAAGGDWNDLVLDAGLRERLAALPETYRARAETEPSPRPALVVVFGGSAGSGKTTAARALAAELGLGLVEVDALAVDTAVTEGSDDLAETLRREAGPLGAVLVIDHADELLRRPDGAAAGALRTAAGAWPDVVVLCAEVTREMPAIAGLAIDATLVFPELDLRAREEIWRRHLPDDHAVPPGAMAYLAQAFRLSGAAIARCCEIAVRLADEDGERVSLRHVAGALDETYRGRLTSDRTRLGLAEVRAQVARSEAAQRGDPDAAARPARRLRLFPRRAAGSQSPRHRSLTAWIVLAAIVFVAALVGLILTTHTASRHAAAPAITHRAASRQVTAGPLWLSAPSGWRVSHSATVGGNALSPGLTLSSASAPANRLVIGLSGPSGPGVPARFHAGYPGSAQPVMLGGQLLYRLAAPGATGTTLYTLPSLRATVVAACEPASPSFASQCTRVLSTLTVAPGALLPTAAQTRYATTLRRVLGPLNATRNRLRPQLRRAPGLALRSQIAVRLAAAHLRAWGALTKFTTGATAVVNRRLASALEAAGFAYARLSVVHVSGGRALKVAEGRVTAANAGIARAEAALTALGYPVP